MVVCTGFIEPLNLECLFVYMFAGNIALFTGIAFILVSALAARFRLPNSIMLMVMVLFVVIFADKFNQFYLIIILILGIVTFMGFGRFLKR